ncbi:hypothetical protein [Sulfuracidifex metallicus]|uniref:Uncharacterized protein n=1 Tax=Sulfuracidifex metallicus DSM 6482 = JCM 9184 TaxID=523847 RepID=A0A6A9QPV4_SULME|nr:hypothetical protein [Sulfuracidifex metallicus]MUN29315.1 hypothetical protein [Sulfuracidifex metallicus DSM 6482 = JCM 9184]WOE50172.1 hypothetical protein RQ359_001679 [Sulfuracidifex metallicus DSM 6482 = JCM 9184]
MLKIWFIHIGIATIGIIITALILIEFLKLNKEFKSKTSKVLSILGGLMVAEFFSFLIDFIMWRNDSNPIYIFPSLVTIVMAFSSLLVFYYYIAKL